LCFITCCASAGTIEIVSDVHLIKAGDKVGASEAALLGKLGVKPFKYGLEIVKVYESGSLFEPAVLEITGKPPAATLCNPDMLMFGF
jgi:hypothetical protein